VRLWSFARSAAEILNNYATEIRDELPGLVGVWALDGDGAADVGDHDSSTSAGIAFGHLDPPPGDWLVTSELPGFRFKVRINETTTGTQVNSCVADTICIAGAIPSRAEVFVRIVGPKPNGFLWPNVVKFTTSAVELWVEDTGTGAVQYYRLAGASPDVDVLPGLFDREGFLP
jgi:hypothetical protein